MILTNQYFHIADTGHVWLHFSFLDISIRDISRMLFQRTKYAWTIFLDNCMIYNVCLIYFYDNAHRLGEIGKTSLRSWVFILNKCIPNTETWTKKYFALIPGYLPK